VGETVETLWSVFVLSTTALMYVLPTIVAVVRKHEHAGPILGLNLLLGWTGIAWLAALLWAGMDPDQMHGGDTVPQV
jgi:hypothetical protein